MVFIDSWAGGSFIHLHLQVHGFWSFTLLPKSRRVKLIKISKLTLPGVPILFCTIHGQLIQNRTFLSCYDWTHAVLAVAQVDASGNVFVAGETQNSLDGNTNAGSWDITVMKFQAHFSECNLFLASLKRGATAFPQFPHVSWLGLVIVG